MTQVAPHPHEFEGHLKFAANGLDPYWALSQLYIYDIDGEPDYQVAEEHAPEGWEITFGFQKSGIAPREEDAASNRLYEWNIIGRGPGEKKASFNVSPRFPDPRHYETGDSLDFAWQHLDADEGVCVSVSGSNVDPQRYRELLPQFCRAIAADCGRGWDGDYFQQPLLDGGTAASSFHTYERYVRVDRDLATKVVRTGGVFDRLAMFLSTQEDSAGEYKWDNDGEVGYRHLLKLDPTGAQALAPSHRLGKQFKHYLLKDPDSVDETDPTWHPKIGALFTKSLNDGAAVPWSKLDAVRQELDEALLNVLEWGDVPIQPGGPTFVADDHFDGGPREDDVPIYADPTPELETKQEHLLVTAMRDMTDADQDVLEVLADGGRTHYAELADEAGYSVSMVYRALERLQGIIESDDGVVDFMSQKVAEDIRGIVDHVERSVDAAADRVAELYDLHASGAANSAFQAWLRKYGADLEVDETGPRKLRIDSLLAKYKSIRGTPWVDRVLREAVEAWGEDGRDRTDLRTVDVVWEDTEGESHTGRLFSFLH